MNREETAKQETTVELIAAAYEAAGDQDRWAKWLDDLSDALSADTVRLESRSFDTGKAPGTPERDARGSGSMSDNLLTLLGIRGFTACGAAAGQVTELVRGALDQDCGTTDNTHCLCGALAHSEPRDSYLVARRDGERPAFGGAEKGLFERLLPHAERAHDLHTSVLAHAARCEALHGLLEETPLAVFLVDDLARPMVLNDAARAILSRQDGLTERNGCLQATSLLENSELRRAISRAVTSGEGRTPKEQYERVALSRSSGARPYRLTIKPVVCAAAVEGGSARRLAAIFAQDREAERASFAADLGESFGLTPAEARLADLIASGRALNEATHRLGITKNTARTHMKRIYAKTGTRRPAALARLLREREAGLC